MNGKTIDNHLIIFSRKKMSYPFAVYSHVEGKAIIYTSTNKEEVVEVPAKMPISDFSKLLEEKMKHYKSDKDRIKEAIKAKGLIQAHVAKKCGYNHEYLGRMLNGRNPLSDKGKTKLFNFLNLR